MKLDCYNYPDCRDKIGVCNITKSTYIVLDKGWDAPCKFKTVQHIDNDNGTVLKNKNVYEITPPTNNYVKVFILPNFWQRIYIDFYINNAIKRIIKRILEFCVKIIKLFI